MEKKKKKIEKKMETLEDQEIQSLLRRYSKILYFSKLRNLKEMERFLDRYNITKFKHHEIKKKIYTTPGKIEAEIKRLPNNK